MKKKRIVVYATVDELKAIDNDRKELGLPRSTFMLWAALEKIRSRQAYVPEARFANE